jgi:hypothetical protein
MSKFSVPTPKLRAFTKEDAEAQAFTSGIEAFPRLFPLEGALWGRYDTSEFSQEEIGSKLAAAQKAYSLVGELCKIIDAPVPDNLVAMGIKKPSHFFFEEFGLGLSSDTDYPDHVKQAAKLYFRYHIKRVKHHLPDMNDFANVKCSFPRGRYSGFPLGVSGSHRALNDIMMAINMRVGHAHLKGWEYPEEFLLAFMVFHRMHPISKEVVMHVTRSEKMMSQNFEPRVRPVNGPVKSYSNALKPLALFWATLGLLSPYGMQDRKWLADSIKRAHSSVAYDSPKFDRYHGGVKLTSALTMMVEVVKDVYPDMPDILPMVIKEATMPALIPWRSWSERVGHMMLVQTPALMSGQVMTSPAGSVMTVHDDMTAFSFGHDVTDPWEICKYYISKEPNRIQSDDLLKLFETGEQRERHDRGLDASNALLGLHVTEELPKKFLGYLINEKGESTYDILGLNEGGIASKLILMEKIPKFPYISRWAKIKYLLQHNPNVLEQPLTRAQMQLADRMLPIVERGLDLMPSWANRKPIVHFEELERLALHALKHQSNDFGVADDILHMIGKGSEFDYNFSRLGLPDYHELQQAASATFSLNDDLELWLSNLNSDSIRTRGGAGHSPLRLAEIFAEAMEIMNCRDHDLGGKLLSFGYRYMREIKTPEGIFFTA